MKKTILIFSILTLSLFLNNCGGGGGGGGGSNSSSFATSEYNQQYGLASIKASKAYDRGYNGNGVKVAVLDGGFDLAHTDLDGNFITGYDTEDSDNTPGAESHNTTMGGHGTHVAGIIAAEKNDSGMHGVAYNASIIPVKVFKDNGTAVSGMNLGIDYATDNGAIALNNSWGTSRSVSGTCNGVNCYISVPYESSTGGFSSAEITSWAGVATDNNVAVFAAGNNGNNSSTGAIKRYRTSDNAYLYSLTAQQTVDNGWISYTNRSTAEAQYALNASAVANNWINVIALDSNNTIASYSNGCGNTKAYCIAAPGTDINSTVPTALDSDGFGTMSGTSMAAPHVSAAIAILKHEYPNLTGAEIVDLLLTNATDLGASGTDDVYGVGLLNLDAATTPSGVMVVALSDSSNNLDKLDLSTSSINFSTLFNNELISKHNFIGVVDDYNRVYSHNMKDYSYFQEKDRSVLDEMFLSTRGRVTEKIKIDQFNTSSFSTTDHSNLIKYGNLKYQSYENPYNQILSTSNDNQTFYNSKLKANFTIFDNKVSKNNFIYFVNFINKNNTKLKLGIVNEGQSFLGTKGSGLFETKQNTKTFFVDYKKKFEIKSTDLLLDLTLGQTQVDFKHSNYIKDAQITTAAYKLGFQSAFEKKKIKNFIGFNHPLGIVNGTLDVQTISGYGNNGDYVNREQKIDLVNNTVSFMTNTSKFFNENSLLNFQTMINNNNSSAAGLYVFKF